MKKITSLFFSLAAVAIVMLFAQCKNTPATNAATSEETPVGSADLKIAYVDIDTLLTNYDFWKALNEEMIRKEENIRATLNQKAKELQADYEEFERKLSNNGFATRERAESEQSRIMKKKQDLDNLQERLSNELATENNKNSMLFRDSINAFLKDYNKDKKYNVILSRIGDNILYIDSSMNITPEIIKGLNERYNSQK